MKTRDLVLVSMFAALTAVFAQISIPLPSGVPVTLQVLAVFLSGAILGSKLGALSQIVYLLLGAIGVPVFAGFSGGLQILIGFTGGYIWSFPIASFIIGFIVRGYKGNNKVIAISLYTLGMAFGLIIIYILGTIQFSIVTEMTFKNSLGLAVLPYIIPDLVKLAIGVPLAYTVRNSLYRGNLITA